MLEPKSIQSDGYAMKRPLLLITLLSLSTLTAAPYDWFEGTQELDNGATRDCYNRAAALNWENTLGDWTDFEGVKQGNTPYGSVLIEDTDSRKTVEVDVTSLVNEWIEGTSLNKGMLLRMLNSYKTVFCSKEHGVPEERPMLILKTASGTDTLSPTDDTFISSSTYQGWGDSEVLSVMDDRSHALLKFDIPAGITVNQATLQLFTIEQYGDNTMGVFRLSQGETLDNSSPQMGIAAAFTNDNGIENHPSVIFATGFESDTWSSEWSGVSHSPQYVTQIESAPEEKFESLIGKAVRVRMGEGSNYGGSLRFKFADKTGEEPEEIYWRYYLRFSDTWNPTVTGGKLPGVAGTYGRAGWGGRPVDGTNGWSARGTFHTAMNDNPPFGENKNPIGWYCYHADMDGSYGDVWYWTKGYNGYLANNKWYAVEQYCKMNTPGQNDGILRGWVNGKLAYEKTDIKFRTVDDLKIEEIWMNVYHGGTAASPADMDLYFDNVVIATEYIGPINSGASAIENPAAKSHTKVVPLIVENMQLNFPEGTVTLYSVNGQKIAAGKSPLAIPQKGIYLVKHRSVKGHESIRKIAVTK